MDFSDCSFVHMFLFLFLKLLNKTVENENSDILSFVGK